MRCAEPWTRSPDCWDRPRRWPQPAGHGRIDLGVAVLVQTRQRGKVGCATVVVLGPVEVDKPAHKQIETSVMIVVKPDSARCPTRSRHARFLGNVGKRAIPVVAIKNAPPILCDIKIGVSIPVVVTGRHSHAIASARHTRLFGHVRESAVAIIVVEGVSQRMHRSKKIAGAAIDEVNIHPTVVVVIEKGASCSRRFGKVFFRGTARRMSPGDTASRRRDF